MVNDARRPLKVLLLVQKEQRVILDRLYEGIAAHTDCDLRWLDDDEQANLSRYFHEHVEPARYERIVLFLRFKKELRQVAFIRTVPNLVILEHDAWQNYFPCKYEGKFSAHYRRLPHARVLSSGFQIAERLRTEGTDAVFVPKGFDQSLLRNLGRERDIELGFVGSVKSGMYSGRKKMLEAIGRSEPLVTVRTQSGEEYLNMLNRIRFFVSADVGMNEYMIKNFEAMACGCVLCAYDQGAAENAALGFVDMENVVLYRDVGELQAKLARLRAAPEWASRIAANGQTLVEHEYTFARIGARVVDSLLPPLRPAVPAPWWEKLRLQLRF